MVAVGLAAVSTLDAATGILYVFVATRLAARHVEGPARRAWTAFQVWWIAIAALSLIDGARGLAAALGAAEPWWPAILASHYAYIALLALSLAALLYYLIYLFTGSERWFVPVALFYGAYLATALAYAAMHQPVGVQAYELYSTIEYAIPASDGFAIVFFVLLFLPQIGCAAGYAALSRRVPDAAARLRVRIVAWSLIAWLGLNLVGDVAGWFGESSWQIGRRVVGLVAVLAILVAYDPPRWVQRRTALEPLA